MAIDLDAIRRKLGQLSGQNSKKNKFWRPTEGEDATIRLLSFADNDGQPFKELWFYYNIGNNPGMLTPNQFGDPDPIQELINTLRNESRDNKSAYELQKKLWPKMRCFAPVIVRGEEDKGVRLWSFGKMVYQELLGYMLDEDYGDITDVKAGRDLKISCRKQPGKKWAETKVTPRVKQTPLSSDKKQSDEWLESVPDPMDLYTVKTYAELSKIINDWMNDDPENSDGESERGGTGAASTPKASAGIDSSKFDDLDAAFDDLE
jgi:hypothetical protein